MGEEKMIPRLCGGTFFTRLLYARENTKKSQNFMFKQLMTLYDPTVSGIMVDSFKTPASQFKNCNQTYNCDYIKIGDTATRRAFENRFETDYEEILTAAEKLCNDHLTRGRASRSDIFVRDILELIMLDITINDDALFYIRSDGSAVKKSEFGNISSLYFPSVVLGIWHFICTQRTDNSVGKDTIDQWNKKDFEGSKNAFPKLKIDYEKEDEEYTEPEVIPYIMDNDAIMGDLSEVDLEKMMVVHYAEHERLHKTRSVYDRYVDRAKVAFCKSKSFFYPNEERELDEFYVCNNITPRFNTFNYYKEGDSETLELRTYDDVKNLNIEKIIELDSNMVIVGTGGLGKSMMMRHLMFDALRTYEKNKIFPVFVILKDYNPERENLLEYIFSQIEEFNWNMEIVDFIDLMNQGKVLLLLDGLDEIKVKYRNKFDDELNRMTQRYNDCYYILSSRPIGRFGEFKQFRVYDLQPFTKGQAIEAIQKLDFRVYNKSIKSDFIEELDKRLYDEKKSFAGNPLLLTIMLITFEQYHVIPTQKFLFYEQAYEALTQKHDATKAYSREYATGLEPFEFKQYFSEFCINTYHDEQYKFTREELEQAFHLIITLNGLKTTPAAFITDATEKICLLYQDGDSYYFCHRSFQEYFAAYFCSRQIEDRYSFIREMFNDKDDNALDDEALEMLYGMDNQKTEKQIIIPFLESLFETGDDHEDYVEFLKRIYPEIWFEKGYVDGWSDTQPQSLQYKFVVEHYGIQQVVCGDDIECDYDIANTIFVYMDKNWNKPDSKEDMELVSVDSLPDGYKRVIDEDYYEDQDDIEYVGMRVRLDPVYLYGKDKFTKYYNKERAILEDENFALNREFYAAKELLEKLKEKYRKKRNTNWITNFH